MKNIFREKFFVLAALLFQLAGYAQIPKGYAGKPFRDSVYTKGPQVIPGRVELAYYDLGGEGVDISYTKDFADFNHPNKVDPAVNQLYIGWQSDGEIVFPTAGLNLLTLKYNRGANLAYLDFLLVEAY